MANFNSDESAFNFAIAYLEEISQSLKMCKYASAQGNAKEWYKWLRIAFRESSVKFHDGNKNGKKNEIEDFDDKFKEINNLIVEEDRTKLNSILTKLDNLEIKLRRKIQERGMLLPSKSDPKFAVLER
jgi:hypothetical protein